MLGRKHTRVAGMFVTIAVGVVAIGLTVGAAGAQTTTTEPTKAAVSKVSLPTVIGPVTGGKGSPTLATSSLGWSSHGYQVDEFFLDGTATSYGSATPLSADGKWTATPQSTAPYRTRVVVYRPAKAKDFNGTVFVEWINVSGGSDAAVDLGFSALTAVRDGAAWIAVSAQAVGVQGGSGGIGLPSAGGLRASDPARYESLTHPGDSFSYDIYSQAGAVARNTTTPRVLGPLRVKHVIGIGESQSASRLLTYIDGVHPIAHVYDGFLVHSVPGLPTPLSQPPQTAVSAPTALAVRDDLDVPVFVLQTEGDLLFNGLGLRRPDTKRYRLWEVPGASHADGYQVGPGFADDGNGVLEKTMLDTAHANGGALQCAQPINLGPQYLAVRAAVHHVDRWVADGVAPPKAPHIDASAGPPLTIHRDEHGNALGGVRTPFVDVPTARPDSERNQGGTFCFLFGHTVPFDAATLQSLYPTHRAYVDAFRRSTETAVERGYILRPEARNLERAAAASGVGSS